MDIRQHVTSNYISGEKSSSWILGSGLRPQTPEAHGICPALSNGCYATEPDYADWGGKKFTGSISYW